MKILTISDLHGRTVWQEVDLYAYDQVIFLGDYTDSYVVDDETIYANLLSIMELKQQQPDRVVLLIGNHDAQYMHYPNYRCSGFRPRAQPELSELFETYADYFQIAHQIGSYLFNHAGVTNKWLARLLAEAKQEIVPITANYALADLLNSVHKQPLQTQRILFNIGPRRGGSDPLSGPVWADRSESEVDYLHGFHQTVGHTPVKKFKKVGDRGSSITYTDVLQTKTAFYEIIIPD